MAARSGHDQVSMEERWKQDMEQGKIFEVLDDEEEKDQENEG